MGKFRSKSGCLTCRNRRVKCDEVHPVCGQCGKKNRACQWEPAHTKFRGYQPSAGSSSATPGGPDDGEGMAVEEESVAHSESTAPPGRRNSWAGHIAKASASDPSGTPMTGILHPPPTSPFLASTESSGGGVGGESSHFGAAQPLRSNLSLSHQEAVLVHHYTEHLGRWLDCTDPARQFTLRIPVQVTYCPILLHAVLSFSARHRRDDVTADQAYQRCIALLIERLDTTEATHDDNLLCAIVILRFYEQLNVSSVTGSDTEQHLAGTSAILRSSQVRTVDPSAPTLREAAFWVYVRQCLYNATINQQPPDLDFSLRLDPEPASMHDSHPLAVLRLETAWANQMTWHCACVVNFCFDNNDPQERSYRSQRWDALWDAVQTWQNTRPPSFDPIWFGHPDATSVFPELWFTADWHVVAFGFYHFSCILLLSYKPGPKFAMRSVGGKLSDADLQILEHARAICGSCKSSPTNVPCLITLCHTIFIWGPLLTAREERNEILDILREFERTQAWPTTWIINALKNEWGLESY